MVKKVNTSRKKFIFMDLLFKNMFPQNIYYPVFIFNTLKIIVTCDICVCSVRLVGKIRVDILYEILSTRYPALNKGIKTP